MSWVGLQCAIVTFHYHSHTHLHFERKENRKLRKVSPFENWASIIEVNTFTLKFLGPV